MPSYPNSLASNVGSFGEVGQVRIRGLLGLIGRLCRDKKLGGQGVKNIEWYNLALFGKWGGKLLRDKESLVSVVLESKYDYRFG
ncbi:hypothetical protein ACS0TY_018972 [Phlomoides rotata]